MATYVIKHNVVTKTGDKEQIVKVRFEVESDSTEEAMERTRSACGRLFRRSGGDALQYMGERVAVSVDGTFMSGMEVHRVFIQEVPIGTIQIPNPEE